MKISKSDIVSWVRWLHVYISMFSYSALFFFAITGLTLNHTEWIEGKQTIEQHAGTLPEAWVHTDSAATQELSIVEHLRNTYSIRAPLKDYSTDEEECAVSFKGPGYNADGYIDRLTGKYELTITQSGWIAILNDLHKGRDTGNVWLGLIDVSALIMVLVSLSGLIMIFFMKRWRISGLALGIIGTAALIAVYLLFV